MGMCGGLCLSHEVAGLGQSNFTLITQNAKEEVGLLLRGAMLWVGAVKNSLDPLAKMP